MTLLHQKSTDNKAVLLVGKDLPITSSDTGRDSVRIVRHNSIAEAIVSMRNEHFNQVVVALPALANHFEPSLAGLRQADPAARIILLARMAEEPLLVEQLSQHRSTRRLFDDYFICPVRFEDIAANTSAGPAAGQADIDKDRQIEELEKLVIQDDLTGLKNRRYLRQFLPQALALAERHQLRVTLLIFDIDDFKHYNDAYGHAVGDNVLQQAARMIQRCCRSHDVVARLGGDEFAVVFWDLPGEKHAEAALHSHRRDRRSAGLEHPREPIFMAGRFCKEIEQAAFEYIGPKGKGALTISGGLATFPIDAKNAEELLKKADMAMLEAKRSGKNRIYLVGQPAADSRQ